MQAIVSVINDTNNNQLWSMRAIGTTISFLVRTPLVMVTVAKTGESDRQLLVYLNYAYDFIVSVLTAPQLSRIFIRFPNFDLRRMLSGTEKILDRLVDWFDEDFGFLLGSVRSIPLPPPLRESINSLLTHSCQKSPGLVFASSLPNDSSSVCHGWKSTFWIRVTSGCSSIWWTRPIRSKRPSPGYRSVCRNSTQSMPLSCISARFPRGFCEVPRKKHFFDFWFFSRGFLHAYIHYLRDSPVCLIYLCVDPTSFHTLAQNSANFTAVSSHFDFRHFDFRKKVFSNFFNFQSRKWKKNSLFFLCEKK